MKKMARNKRQPQVSSFNEVDVNMVCYLSDEELYRSLHALVETREEWVRNGVEATPVEVEMCYIRRELQIRSARRDAHDQYVRALHEDVRTLEAVTVSLTASEVN